MLGQIEFQRKCEGRPMGKVLAEHAYYASTTITVAVCLWLGLQLNICPYFAWKLLTVMTNYNCLLDGTK